MSEDQNGLCLRRVTPRRADSRPWLDLLQRLRERVLGDLRIVGHLRTKPIEVGQAEKPAQAQIGVCGDGAAARDDLADALGRDADLFGETTGQLGEAEPFCQAGLRPCSTTGAAGPTSA